MDSAGSRRDDRSRGTPRSRSVATCLVVGTWHSRLGRADRAARAGTQTRRLGKPSKDSAGGSNANGPAASARGLELWKYICSRPAIASTCPADCFGSSRARGRTRRARANWTIADLFKAGSFGGYLDHVLSLGRPGDDGTRCVALCCSDVARESVFKAFAPPTFPSETGAFDPGRPKQNTILFEIERA